MLPDTNQKRNISFVDAKNKKFNLEINLTFRNNYPEFTISGDSGQCKDRITPEGENQKKIIDFWSLYHLNGSNAGTKKQTEILKDFKNNDYSDSCDHLQTFKNSGELLTLIEYKEMIKNIKLFKFEVDITKRELKSFNDLETELKLVKRSGWYYPKTAEGRHLVETLARNEKSRNFDLKGCIFLEGYRIIFKAIDKKIYNDLKKETEKKLENAIENLNAENLKSLLYDIHPETGEPFKYGSGWIKTNLPDFLWADVEKTCLLIEDEEEEKASEFKKVEDLKNLDENDPFRQELEEIENENILALALSLDLNIEEARDIEVVSYGYGENILFDVQGIEYYCGTDQEINKALEEYVKQTVWAFNASFLAEETDLPKEVFEVMSSECEAANDAILKIIDKTCGIEEFCNSAAAADGYAHFLNGYDSTGSETVYNDTKYFICRT